VSTPATGSVLAGLLLKMTPAQLDGTTVRITQGDVIHTMAAAAAKKSLFKSVLENANWVFRIPPGFRIAWSTADDYCFEMTTWAHRTPLPAAALRGRRTRRGEPCPRSCPNPPQFTAPERTQKRNMRKITHAHRFRETF